MLKPTLNVDAESLIWAWESHAEILIKSNTLLIVILKFLKNHRLSICYHLHVYAYKLVGQSKHVTVSNVVCNHYKLLTIYVSYCK